MGIKNFAKNQHFIPPVVLPAACIKKTPKTKKPKSQPENHPQPGGLSKEGEGLHESVAKGRLQKLLMHLDSVPCWQHRLMYKHSP